MASFKNLVSTTSAQISSGGTITGSLVIEGDLQVDGGGSLSFDEIVQGTQVIDVDNTEALLVRKDSDGGDVFIVDTTNSRVGIGGTPHVNATLNVKNSSGTAFLYITSANDADSAIVLEENATAKWIIGNDGNDSDNLKFGTGGGWASETKMTLTSGGSLGIGVAPTKALTVKSSGSDDGIMLLESTGTILATIFQSGDASGYPFLDLHDGAGDTKPDNVKVRLNSGGDSFFKGGNVGIGTTTSPESLLHIQGDTTAQMQLHNTSSGNAPKLLFDGLVGANADYVLGSVRASWDTHTNIVSEIRFESGADTTNKDDGLISFHTSPASSTVAERMRIDQNGHVGIGAIPDGILFRAESSVNGNWAGLIKNTHSTNGSGLKVQAGDDANVDSFRVSDVSNTTLFNITGDGTATFSGDVLVAEYIKHEGDTDTNIRFQTDHIDLTTANTLALRVDNSQNVGIGISPVASQKLQVKTASNINFSVSAVGSALRINAVNDAADATAPLEMNATNTKFLSSVGIGVTPSDYFANYDNLVVGATSGHTGITIVSGDDSYGTIAFADGTSGSAEFEGEIQYRHSDNELSLGVGGNRRMIIDANSRISISNNGGGSNTTFGYLALNSATANVASNVAIGHETLKAMDGTESGNVAIGYRAMLSVDENVNSGGGTNSADFNVAIGYDALTGGQFSDGNDSNNKNLTGNVAIGANALNSTGTNPVTGAVAIGQSSLTAMTSGANNTAVGYISGASVTTGSYNTFLGDRSGDGTDDGNSNTAVGYGSLSANCGNYNVSIGAESLFNATGSQNTAIGFQSGFDVSGGVANTLVGSSSGMNLTSGSNNVAIGDTALATATDSANIVAIGIYAGDAINNSGADGTVAIGRDALGALTSGAGNTAVGYQSMDATDDGSYNTAVGYTSLSANCGDSNTCIGYASGLLITGSMNTTIGTDAGNGITSGTNNVVIGKGSDTDDATATNQTVVGYATTGVADNSVTLGNADVTDVYMAQDSGATVHCAGIQFPASQVANVGANVLDDYEEGDYDITFTCGTSGTITLQSGFNRASYVKIGSFVSVTGLAIVDSVSSPSGFISVNLPFTPANLTDRAGDSAISLEISGVENANVADFQGAVNEGTAVFYIQLGDAETRQTDSAEEMKASTQIHFSVQFRA